MSGVLVNIGGADEAYLISLSNKGLYNRAVRELPDSGLVLNVEGETISGLFSDGVTIAINGSIADYKCSCPSRTVCKHLLMTILAVKRDILEGSPPVNEQGVESATESGAEQGLVQSAERMTESDAGQNADHKPASDAIQRADCKIKSCVVQNADYKPASDAIQSTDAKIESCAVQNAKADDEPDNPFSYVIDTTDVQLMKLAGKKVYGAALLEAKFGERAKVQETGSLSITLPDSGETVRFLPAGDLNTSVCTCKSGSFCVHRTQAVLEYIIQKKGELPAESDSKEEKIEFEYGSEALSYVKGFVYEVFASGLARLPEDSAGRFLQLATICHSRRLANPDRLCNRISGQLRHFDRKSAAFNRETLVGDLCALYSLCDHIEKEGGTPATVGVFRDTYQPVGSMEIWGLGAYGWHSTGGYTGVTTLFFSLKQNRILRFTAAMPNSVSPGADKLYNSGAPWGMNIKLSSLSHSRVSIKGAKLNASGQLSSTESCNAEALGNVDINNPVLAKLRFEDFRLLADALWVHLESQNEGTGTILTVLITPDRLDKGTFDRVSQTFHMPLYDREGRNLNISVKFQESTRLLLTNLALLDNEFETWGYGMFLVNVYIDNGKLTAFPITHFGRKIRNLSLDAEAVNNKGNHKFDWDLL